MHSKGRIVDAWMQHPTKDFLAQPMFESLRRWAHGGLPATEVPIEATLAAMDEAGVRLGLICAWWGPQGPLIGNDEVAAFVRQYPGQLVGIGAVDLSRPMEAVRELRRCVQQLGFRGLRIVPWLWNLPPDDRRYYPSTPSALNSGFRSASKWATPAPCAPRSPVVPFPTWTTWRSNFQNCESWRDTSAFRGSSR
jgi:predicted TIM-barrel fold metal-dependent hydrolase